MNKKTNHHLRNGERRYYQHKICISESIHSSRLKAPPAEMMSPSLLCKAVGDLPLLGVRELLPPGSQLLSLRPLFCSAHSVRGSGPWGGCRHISSSRLWAPWAAQGGSRLVRLPQGVCECPRRSGPKAHRAGSRQEGGKPLLAFAWGPRRAWMPL